MRKPKASFQLSNLPEQSDRLRHPCCLMNRLHILSSRIDTAGSQRPICLECMVLLSMLILYPLGIAGCSNRSQDVQADMLPLAAISARQVAAQGKLLPSTGIISLSALPGDQIESVLVKSGQVVSQGDVLVVMRSNRSRQIELEVAQQKLQEARSQVRAKKSEASLAVQSAELQVQKSELAVDQATKQLSLIKSGDSQLELAQQQMARMTRLQSNPVTRDLVGQSDLDSKSIELQRATQLFKQSVLNAEQMLQSSKLSVIFANEGVEAAKQTLFLIDNSSSIESLEKQIELLQVQLEQTLIVSPSNATVLAIYGSAGEAAGPTPILEIGDLTSMVCIAEVHEVDVARLKLGNPALINSAALPRDLKGSVSQINPLVGSPQLRLPNPLARTDFRSVPVRINIAPEDQAIAAALVQLQVDVTVSPPAVESQPEHSAAL